jgi:hypothetical protein
MNRFVHVVAAALSLSVVAGCAGPTTGQGRPPAYADGFNDGCQSGRAAQDVLGRPRKDVRRFESDPQYAQGWSDGYRQCEYEQMQKNASGGL